MTPINKTILSAVQPTGQLTIGNYLGAIKNWIGLQDDNNCIFFVVDLHALTVRHVPADLRKSIQSSVALYLACGLDPDKSSLYVQSHLPQHAELSWVLSCYAMHGELARMTQFKDKSAGHADNINAGLFTYPVLQAADILLFQTNLVPVGRDQKQHLELCRDVAVRFNNIYGDIFTIPEPYIASIGAKVMSLQDPEKKMSKSDTVNENNVIFLLDDPSVIMKKFKRAVTDSLNQVKYDPEGQPGLSNLITLYACAVNRTIEECVAEFADCPGYGHIKTKVGEAVVAMLEPFQKRFKELQADPGYIDEIIKNNAERANAMSQKTLEAVKNAIGFPK